MARFVSTAATLGLLTTGLAAGFAQADEPGPKATAAKPAPAGKPGAAKPAPATPAAKPPAAPTPRAGTPLLNETFTGATADSRFTAVGSACLTGAPSSPAQSGDHPLVGCPMPLVGPAPPPNGAPHGYLQLTDASNDQSGAVLFDQALPAGNGLDVTFDQWQYGSTTPNTPADGISFFLVNGDTGLTHPGAFGGSLGYAQKLPDDNPSLEFLPGVDRGYLGVGLDVLGNFFGDWEHRGNGCPTRSPAGTGIRNPAPGQNKVTIRGPGDGLEGYCFLTSTTSNFTTTGPWPSTLPGTIQGPLTTMPPGVTPQQAETLLEPSRRRVNVHLTPAPAPVLTVSMDFGSGMQQVLQTAAPMPVPSTYKFGFAGSTGLFTDVHLIRNVVVTTDAALPELNLVKQIHEPRPGELTPGTPVQYDFVVTNSGGTPIDDLGVQDPKVGPVSCPVSVLQPGETVTCTSTYLVTAADVAAGMITNTAIATGTSNGDPVTSPESTVTVPIDAPPGITLQKEVQGTGPFNVGDTVNYTYVVTNTGGTEVTGLSVVDDKVTGITCASTTLAPSGQAGDTTTCTGTYVVTPADADSGKVVNTAHAAGTSNGTPIESPPTDATIEVVSTSSLGLTKTASTPGPVNIGDTVTYTYTVTNTGTTTLTDLNVFDDHVSGITCQATSLAAGASTTCTGTYVVTDADGALGQLTNRAQAAANNPQGGAVLSPEDTVTLPVIGASGLTLEKTASTPGPVNVGDTVTYTYTVTNTGQTALTGIAVQDSRVSSVTCQATSLAAGASTTCTGTYTVTEADAVAGSITNTAMATGIEPDGNPVNSPPDTVTLEVVSVSSMTIDKTSAATGPVNVGDTVTYAYTVTNTGTSTLTGVTVVDDHVTNVNCDRTTLAPRESATCTGTYVVTAADGTAGSVTNTAHATGTNPGGETVTSPDDAVTVPVIGASSMTIEKTPSTAGPVHVGDTITYTYTVTNTGQTALNNIAVTDDKVTGITCQATTLAAGASTTCTGTYVVTAADGAAGKVTNTAHATGTNPGGGTVTSPPDDATVTVIGASSMTVEKTPSTAGPVHVGDTITYTYTVTNTGQTNLTNIAVTDDKVTGITCQATTLAAGASTTCTGTYVVTDADAAAGKVTNRAHATGTDPGGDTVTSPPDEVTVPVTGASKLVVTKKADVRGPVKPGDTITYTYTVTNEGSTTLSDIAIVDDKVTDITCEDTTLAPGASTTCTGTYTVTVADAKAGHVTNKAHATGTDPDGNTVDSPTVKLKIRAVCPPKEYGDKEYGDDVCKDHEHDHDYGDKRGHAKAA
ncbi:DUF7507 domain-containing protein [Streptomyces laurentii]|uniref:DUF7507 domain-containing protein n=1 Tax=Streptomyces laurentii TaxID=39478 RepID=UPI0036970F5E